MAILHTDIDITQLGKLHIKFWN